jgi:hypothetical protein
MTSTSGAATPRARPPNADALRELARRIDAAPSVARRSGGAFGVAAAYLPGERIEGIRFRDEGALEIHVVMRWEFTVDDVEREVLAAVGDFWPSEEVSLFIDDIVGPAASAAVESGSAGSPVPR